MDQRGSASWTSGSEIVANLDFKENEGKNKIGFFVPEAEKSCVVVRSSPRLMKRGSPLYTILEVSDNGTPQQIAITSTNGRHGVDGNLLRSYLSAVLDVLLRSGTVSIRHSPTKHYIRLSPNSSMYRAYYQNMTAVGRNLPRFQG